MAAVGAPAATPHLLLVGARAAQGAGGARLLAVAAVLGVGLVGWPEVDLVERQLLMAHQDLLV